MDRVPSERMQALLDAASHVVEHEVVPLEARFLREGFPAVEPELAALRVRVKQRGLWAPQLPKPLGGLGLSLVEHARMSEVLGRSPLGHYAFGCQAPDAGNIEILDRFGTAEQRRRWLEPLCRGELRSSFALTEPELAGSNPTRLGTRARREGDHYVLDGHKWFITAADGAQLAIVVAVTDPDAAPHRRASVFLVPTATPGFVRVRNVPIFGHAGAGWASHAELRLEGVRVPVDHRLGEEGAGFTLAQERLGPGRIHHAMRWIGICERALGLLCRRAVARVIDDQRLAQKQVVQIWIAESRAEIDAARLLVLAAAERADAAGFREAQAEVSAAKFFVAGVLDRVLDRAVQVHGAAGLTDETVLAWFHAHERGSRIYDGADEVHKLVVARRELARYA